MHRMRRRYVFDRGGRNQQYDVHTVRRTWHVCTRGINWLPSMSGGHVWHIHGPVCLYQLFIELCVSCHGRNQQYNMYTVCRGCLHAVYWSIDVHTVPRWDIQGYSICHSVYSMS